MLLISDIELRAIEEAKYTIEHKSTVRQTAKEFGVCKSTVFRDLTVVLPETDSSLAASVADVLKTNLEDRHNRGGEATRTKYKGKE